MILRKIYEMKKYLYNIYFEFCSDTRITKCLLLKHSKINIDGIPKTMWVVEHFRVFRCSIWVLRRPGMGGTRAPRPLRFMPVNISKERRMPMTPA